ncbi:NUDIX hydrolase [Candidatus Bathyarchaeota archaeon]|jgi:8-oxo-dGTP diphosphatase|nr:NUDIX hydrolase [Candidatus Bathyarchaeota archaeon]
MLRSDNMKFTGRTATAIIAFPPDKVLLVKRHTLPFKGFWALPGGRVCPGETVEETIVREVKEETGIDIEIVRKIGEYHEQGVQDGLEYDYHPACFLAKMLSGEIRKQKSEIEEIKLFSLDEVPASLAFEHAQMIEDFTALRKKNID